MVLSHLGPGLTNAATGVANAALEFDPDGGHCGRRSKPLLRQASAPGDQPPRRRRAMGSLSPVREARLARRAGRPLPGNHRKAFQLAESGRPGPVLVSVPMDIFSASIDVELFERVKPHTTELVKPSLDEETAKQIVVALGDAERPVIYAGGGVLIADAAKSLRRSPTI